MTSNFLSPALTHSRNAAQISSCLIEISKSSTAKAELLISPQIVSFQSLPKLINFLNPQNYWSLSLPHNYSLAVKTVVSDYKTHPSQLYLVFSSRQWPAAPSLAWTTTADFSLASFHFLLPLPPTYIFHPATSVNFLKCEPNHIASMIHTLQWSTIALKVKSNCFPWLVSFLRGWMAGPELV